MVNVFDTGINHTVQTNYVTFSTLELKNYAMKLALLLVRFLRNKTKNELEMFSGIKHTLKQSLEFSGLI